MKNQESTQVTIKTAVTHEGYECTIVATASWVTAEGEEAQATSARQIDTYKAQSVKGLSVEDAIESTKRDALRELVTQLNLHGVL
ncbi:MAG: hypothetical protein [Bacteriophage sp.]|nr:MAG: hypothetical protein [Bacteriophage sp.]